MLYLYTTPYFLINHFDKIISDLYQLKELDDCISKFIRPNHRDDFKQDLFLILYDRRVELTEAHRKGGERFYVVRIIINLATQKRNIYHKNYLGHESKTLLGCNERFFIDKPEDIEQRKKEEKDEQKMVEEINNLDDTFGTFYFRVLCELVAKHGSMREVSRRTGIDVSVISRSIKKVREYLVA